MRRDEAADRLVVRAVASAAEALAAGVTATETPDPVLQVVIDDRAGAAT